MELYVNCRRMTERLRDLLVISSASRFVSLPIRSKVPIHELQHLVVDKAVIRDNLDMRKKMRANHLFVFFHFYMVVKTFKKSRISKLMYRPTANFAYCLTNIHSISFPSSVLFPVLSPSISLFLVLSCFFHLFPPYSVSLFTSLVS
jgi:hypothetical protein